MSESNFKAEFNKELDQILKDYLDNKMPDVSQGNSQLNKIYQLLIKPFEADLETDLEYDMSQIKTLVFVLEGALRNLPMSVLYDSRRERYLPIHYKNIALRLLRYRS